MLAETLSPAIRLLGDEVGLVGILEALAPCQEIAIDTETYSIAGQKIIYQGQEVVALPPRGMIQKENAFIDPYSNRVRLIQLMGRRPDGSTTDIFVIDLWKLQVFEKDRLAGFLNRTGILWVGQNLKFDWKMLYTTLGVKLKRTYCLMLASQILGHATGKSFADQRGHGLKDMARDFLGVHVSKEEQASNWGAKELTDAQVRYAAKDVEYVFRLKDKFDYSFHTDWKVTETEDVYGGVELEMRVLPVIAKMELRGLGFDLPVYKLVQECAKRAIPGMKTAIGKAFGLKMQVGLTPAGPRLQPNIDFNSPAQLVKMLNEAGIPAENAQSDHLDDLKHEHPRLKLIVEFLQVYKQATFDYEAWIHPVTGRIHPSFIQCGAATGRFSCTTPNLQQVPRMDLQIPEHLVPSLSDYQKQEYVQYDDKTGEFKGYFVNYRMCFIATEGSAFCTSDFSGQEVAVAIGLSRDESMAAILRQPAKVPDPDGKLNEDGTPVMVKNMAADIHAGTAAVLWADKGITVWNAKKTPYPGIPGKTYRDIVKAIVFGLLYGKSSKSLAEEMGISDKDAQAIIDTFFQPFPSLKAWLGWAAKTAKNSRLVIFGANGIYRVRFVGDSSKKDKGAMERAGMNTPIQGLSALMTKLALVYLDERLERESEERGMDLFLTCTVHDEINGEAPWEFQKSMNEILKEEMERAQDFFLDKFVPAKSEPGSGRYWQK